MSEDGDNLYRVHDQVLAPCERDFRSILARLAVLEAQAKDTDTWFKNVEHRVKKLEAFQIKMLAYATLAITVAGWLFQKYAQQGV